MPVSKSEIESLIYLLEDPDPVIQSEVENRLRQIGEHAVPLLDQHRSKSVDESERVLLSEILHRITFAALYEEFHLLLERGMDRPEQLEEAIFLLARFGNPTLHIPPYRRRLDRFSAELAVILHREGSERRKVRRTLDYLFGELAFRGDQKEYHHPENALIDRVMDRRRGLPLSLSLIALFIARRAGLPLYGINMPIHFMLRYETSGEAYLIDPFDGGTIVTHDQCHYFLKKNGIVPRPEHFQVCDERTMLVRFMRNLIYSYSKRGDVEKAGDLEILLEVADPDRTV